MPYLIKADTVGLAWINLLRQIYAFGSDVESRGLQHREITNVVWHVSDARNNLLVHPLRNLSYRFAVAEWLWIWFGHNDVDTIAQYNPNIVKFSDDGLIFKGAYGPLLKKQRDYIYGTLLGDCFSRQAVSTIFSPNPSGSKDIPCTVSVQFLIRKNKLHTSVNMRSSDVWLGLPYDVFTFSMIGNILACDLGVDTGGITYHIGSSHLYKIDKDKAFNTLKQADYISTIRSPQLDSPPPILLNRVLESKKLVGIWTSKNWGRYARVLTASNNQTACNILKENL